MNIKKAVTTFIFSSAIFLSNMSTVNGANIDNSYLENNLSKNINYNLESNIDYNDILKKRSKILEKYTTYWHNERQVDEFKFLGKEYGLSYDYDLLIKMVTDSKNPDISDSLIPLFSCVVNDTIYFLNPTIDILSDASMISFNTATGEFKTLAKPPEYLAPYPIYGFYSMANINDDIYVIGGIDSSYNILNNKLHKYNISTNTWSEVSNSMSPRALASMVAIDNKLYIMGGMSSDDNFDNPSKIVEVYDTTTGNWSTLANMTIGGASLSLAVLDNKIYAAGKCTQGNFLYEVTTETSLEVYDIKNNVWTRKKDVEEISDVSFLKIFKLNGQMFSLSSSDALVHISMYIPSSDSWNTVCELSNDELLITKVTPPNIIVYNEKAYLSEVLPISFFSSGSYIDNAFTAFDYLDLRLSSFGISIFRDAINNLPESSLKDSLQSRLGNYYEFDTTTAPKTVSANSDIYIKMSNTLSLSLNTTSITFEDFTGTEDMIKENAINLTVESSLPYEVSASLEDEIRSIGGAETVDKSVLGIKSNTESIYNTFSSIGDPIVLLDNEEPGEVNTHSIDLKLNKNIISKADVYKSSIRFEVRQK